VTTLLELNVPAGMFVIGAKASFPRQLVRDLAKDRFRLQCYVQAGQNLERNLTSVQPIVSFSSTHQFSSPGKIALRCGFSNRTRMAARALVYELKLWAIKVEKIDSIVLLPRKETFAWGGATYGAGDLEEFVTNQLGGSWSRYVKWASRHPGADSILGP
jgi:hypothetical protein